MWRVALALKVSATAPVALASSFTICGKSWREDTRAESVVVANRRRRMIQWFRERMLDSVAHAGFKFDGLRSNDIDKQTFPKHAEASAAHEYGVHLGCTLQVNDPSER